MGNNHCRGNFCLQSAAQVEEEMRQLFFRNIYKYLPQISGKMVSFKTILLASALSLNALGCNAVKLGIYPEEAKLYVKGSYDYGCKASKETLDGLLSDIWNSGVVEQNEIVRKLLLDVRYGIISKDFNTESFLGEEESKCGENDSDCKREIGELEEVLEICKKNNVRACYISRKKKEDILLIKDKLFCHLSYNHKGDSEYKNMDERIEDTLWHELVHRNWDNFLSNDKQLMFSVESEIFYNQMLMAKTEKQKLKFLRKIGFAKPKIEDFNSYEGLEKRREKEEYADKEKFFGTELYAILADGTFAGKMIIPERLRPAYEGLFSKEYLNKNEL